MRRLLTSSAAIGLAVTGLSVAGLSVTTQPVPAVAAMTSAGSCTDGGGVVWRSKVTWGVLYKASDGITRMQVDYAGWTTAKAGVIPTDSEVRSYDGNGKLLQTLTKSTAVDYKAGTVYDAQNPANPPSTPGRAKITIKTGVDGDGFGNCLVTFVQPGSPVVAAAGDIACAPGSVVGTGCQHKAVSDKLLADTEVGTVLALGDLQYPSGTLDAFKTSYAPTWGRLKNKTKPVPGNHEYNTTGAAGYYDYFGAQAGNRSKGYYSFDVGAWHFVALNSERDTGASGAQVAWLKADLRAHPKKCVAAFFHAPRWSSGEHGGTTNVAAFVKELYAANADLMLSGHDHNYERFHPLNPSGVRDDARGIVQIVSGLGGKSQRTVIAKATSAAANRSSYGYSRLVLHAGSADITYVSAVGSYTDSSKLTCH